MVREKTIHLVLDIDSDHAILRTSYTTTRMVWCCQTMPVEWQILPNGYGLTSGQLRLIGALCLLFVFRLLRTTLINVILNLTLEAFRIVDWFVLSYFDKRVPVVKNDSIDFQGPISIYNRLYIRMILIKNCLRFYSYTPFWQQDSFGCYIDAACRGIL